MRFVILHYHFFKNAGSTVENILDKYFGERFCRLDTPDAQACLPNADLLSHLHAHQNLCAVASHQIRHPVPTAPGFLFFDLCFLRDPLDRIASIYYYLREKPGEGNLLSEVAVRYELRDFLTYVMEHLPHYVNNVQVNLLANGGQGHESPSHKDLDCAARRMLETSFLGVVECFYESLIAGQYLLNPVFPGFDCAQLPVNASNRVGDTLASRMSAMREACGEKVFSELMRMNALDSELVRLARAEVRRRFGLVPDGTRRLLEVTARLQNGRDSAVKLHGAPA